MRRAPRAPEYNFITIAAGSPPRAENQTDELSPRSEPMAICVRVVILRAQWPLNMYILWRSKDRRIAHAY